MVVMTSISIVPMERDDMESKECQSLHLSSTYYSGDDDTYDQHIHRFDEQWIAKNNVNLPFHESDLPPSPISVLGARPMVHENLSKWIIQQESKGLSPQVIFSSSPSPSDDQTKWMHMISPASLVLSVLPGNHTDDSLNDSTKTLGFDDDKDQMIVPQWKLLQEKRLALCRQRVHLERRLFETSIRQKKQINNDAMLHQPMKTYIIQHNNNNSDPYEVLWSGSVDADGLPTGFGRMINVETGQVYEGQCVRGLRHGQGRNVWTANEQIYTGEWINNQREGRGTHTWPDGRSVTGSWKKGHLHGRVFFSWPNGTTYDGDAVKGQKEGRGTQTWSDGRTYTGQYKAGSAHGVGMLTESNQSKYRGQFQNGSRHGYGVQLWHDKLYEGEWCNNEVHGRGSLLWRSTGATYTGEFNRGLYHGIGIYNEGNKQYIGQWREGYKNGEGKAKWSNGRSYEGSFCRNKRHGYGRMMYSDCSLYIGGWKNGKRCGQGISTSSNGIVQHCGLWINDRPSDACNDTKMDKEKRTSTDDLHISYQKYSNCSQSESEDGLYGIDRSMVHCHTTQTDIFTLF